MKNNSQKPREYDAVLGGKSPPPLNGVVLGGIDGLQQRLQTGNIRQQLESLPDALKYGENGIDLLIQILNDEEIEVRAKAFQLLQDIESETAKETIASGILLKPRDKVYCVYQSSLSYGDDWYYLVSEIDEYYESEHPFYREDINNEEGRSYYITDSQEFSYSDEYYEPKLVFILFDNKSADKAALSIHL